MKFDRIRREYLSDGIGSELRDFLVDVCRRVARKYPPGVYNDGEPWGQSSFESLAHEVIAVRLLPDESEQLHYVFALAGSENELGRLLAHQVRRTLARRRGVTVSDRLLRRVSELARTDAFTSWTSAGVEWLAADRVADPNRLTDADVREGVTLVADIPRLPTLTTATRESMIYTTPSLRAVVDRLIARFGAVAAEDLRRTLENLLTPWLPTSLRESEDSHDSGALPDIEAQRSEVEQLVITAVRAMDPARRRILLGKSQRVSDSDLASSLGRSRPWIAKEGKLAIDEVRSLMRSVPAELQEDATVYLLHSIAAEEEGEEVR
jgi:hypothetical protein